MPPLSFYRKCMPKYEYTCLSCDKSEEVERKMSDDEIVPQCETCGSFMTRSYTSVGISFKGSGFYKTDNQK